MSYRAEGRKLSWPERLFTYHRRTVTHFSINGGAIQYDRAPL